MFKKRESIEQDFMAYGAPAEHKHGSDGGFLSKLIQLLTVLILTGAVGLMGLFGYRYIQKDQQIKANEAAAQAGISLSTSAHSAVATAVANAPKERMYTQEEMQEIVKMLMQQIQTTSKTETTHSAVVPKKEKEKIDMVTETTEENDADALVAALNLTAVDELEEDIPEIPQNLQVEENVKASDAKDKKKIDHYNKVVINKSKNTYDDLANLSEEIGNIVDSMSKKSKSAKYTAAIQKEVSTRKSEMRVIIVKSGDTLSKIAKRAYGNAMAYDRILKANPELIKNPNNIYIGQRLRVPTDNI